VFLKIYHLVKVGARFLDTASKFAIFLVSGLNKKPSCG